MADEVNRRMDLNLYLGLPRRRTESSDLGSDLALGSLPLSEEMSSSNTQSYPPVPQPAVLQGDTTVNGFHQDVEYNPYSPSFVPSSPTSQAQREAQNLGIVPDMRRPYLYDRVLPTNARDSTEGMVLEGSSSNHGEYVPYSASYAPSISMSIPAELQEAQEENTHVPYVPVPPTNTQVNSNNVNSGPPPVREGSHSFIEVEDGSLQEFMPELRFRRVMEADRHLRVSRRYRSRVPSGVNSDWSSFSSEAVPAARDTRVPEVSAETTVVPQKASAKGVPIEDLEQNDTCNGSANFDCNVCLDVAKEPVVTSCGHLFCWPCLFQWLHIHCDHRECPVCKGEVTEADITPIYGRGNSEKEIENQGKEVESGLKIPPRPHGRRLESLRQRIRRPPLLRRSRDELGSWSFIFDEEMSNRTEDLEVPPTLRSFEGTDRRMISRLMAAQRFQWEDGFENMLNFGGNGSSSNANEVVHVESHFEPLPGYGPPSAPVLVRRGLDFWRRFAVNSILSTDRLNSIAADISNGVGGIETGVNNSGASASTSANPRASRVQRPVAAAADQASASSTIAMIQGEPSIPREALGEPSSVGSSRTLRRSRRYTPSGSLDIDAVDQAYNRRRLN